MSEYLREGVEEYNIETDKKESELLKKVEGWFKEARKYRDDTTKRWNANIKIHENRQDTYEKETTDLKFNLSLIDVRAQMNIISDFLPSIDVIPKNSFSRQYADSVQIRLNQILEDSSFRDKALDTIEQSLILSNGIFYCKPKVSIEYIDENGLKMGETVFDNTRNIDVSFDPLTARKKVYVTLDAKDVDASTCYPAPGATSLDLNYARYIIFATPLHVDEGYRLYHKRIPAEGYMDKDDVFNLVDKNAKDYETLANSYLLKECYWLDDDREKYPCGREVVWANGELIHNKPLWDGYTPRPGHYSPGMPYFCIKNYGTSRKWVGVGEPEIIGKIKKSLDETVSAAADNVLKMGNPAVKVSTAWLASTSKRIRHTPAEQIAVDRDSDVKFVPPEGIPASSFSFFELLMKMNQMETGQHEVSLGERDKRVESGRAIEALQEAAESVVRDKLNTTISQFLTMIGKQVVWYLQEFDKEPMDILQEGKLNEDGSPSFFQYNPSGIRNGEFKIRVVPGIRLRQGRVATEERALRLMELGIYGIEETVKDLCVENKQEIIKGYYDRQGILQFKNGYEAFQKIIPEFESYCKVALKKFESKSGGKSKETWVGSLEEQKLSDLLYQYPELLVEDDFIYMPMEYKKRLLSIFLSPPVDRLGGFR